MIYNSLLCLLLIWIYVNAVFEIVFKETKISQHIKQWEKKLKYKIEHKY